VKSFPSAIERYSLDSTLKDDPSLNMLISTKLAHQSSQEGCGWPLDHFLGKLGFDHKGSQTSVDDPDKGTADTFGMETNGEYKFHFGADPAACMATRASQ